MVFRADPVAAVLVAVVVAGPGEDVVDSVVDEQLTMNRATQAANPAMRVGRAFKNFRASPGMRSAFSVKESIIFGTTASVVGFAHPP